MIAALRRLFRPGNTRRASSVSYRGFAAAEVSRLLAGWKWDGGFSVQEITAQLATIRARSREMAKNNPHHKRFIQMFEQNVVGDGFSFKSCPRDIVKGEAKIDTKAAKQIERDFWRWATTPAWCDHTGRKTIAEIDRLCAKTWARDGEYFLILLPASNPFGITVRVLRPDYVPEWYNAERLANGNVVRCGVEFDPNTMKPSAYYVQTIPPYAYVTTTRGPLARFPAAQVIHGFDQEDEEQPRGVPLGHAALTKLKMLEEYDLAELTAARDEACSVRTYYAPKGDGDQIADLTAEENRDAADALMVDKEPGQSEVLPIGWKQEIHTPQHPNREVTPFKTSMLKDVATGYGLEYANFANDWSGVSFSSVRSGTIVERDSWVVRQAKMIEQSKSPLFLAWLKSYLAISVSGDLPVQKFEKFSEHEFRGRRWMWVDPMRDMAAAALAVDRKWKTNTQVAADMGGDYSDNVAEARAEQELASGNAQTTDVLNGAQIAAAITVTTSYASGEIAAEAAVALLTAAGVPLDTAKNMISKQPVKEPQEMIA